MAARRADGPAHGLRLGELRGLRWTDVDLVHVRVRVEQNITDAGVGSPKSGMGRTLPLAAAILQSTRRTVNVHLLRHTFASHAVLLGVPIRVVQEWLGHADISMTMRYAHLSPEGHRDLIERLVPGAGEDRGEHIEST